MFLLTGFSAGWVAGAAASSAMVHPTMSRIRSLVPRLGGGRGNWLHALLSIGFSLQRKSVSRLKSQWRYSIARSPAFGQPKSCPFVPCRLAREKSRFCPTTHLLTIAWPSAADAFIQVAGTIQVSPLPQDRWNENSCRAVLPAAPHSATSSSTFRARPSKSGRLTPHPQLPAPPRTATLESPLH